jgi:predicted phage terminase large subunit-like protein
LGKNPSRRIIVASYSEKLAIRHSLDCRIIIQSLWFRNIFQNCKLSADQNEKHRFSTTKNGYRFATSIGGTLTGEGGDILIVDDPHNPQQVMNSKYRQKVFDWYGNTFVSRLNDKKNGSIVIVMQRLHANDLTGYLLDRDYGDWTHLSLPMQFDSDRTIVLGDFRKKVNAGDFLFPKREAGDEMKKMKLAMGSYFFNAQYQQKPMANDFGMIRSEWFREFTENYQFNDIYLSFDTAIKSGANNDPTVCTVWGKYENNYYLLEVIRKWLEYPELKRQSIDLIRKWKPLHVLIEDKGSGQALVQDLKRETGHSIIAIGVKSDKITRFASITPLFESGRIFLKSNEDWLFDYKNELLTFPNGIHDDQVDSTSQFLGWIIGHNGGLRNIRMIRL